jgi:hypothetical protein
MGLIAYSEDVLVVLHQPRIAMCKLPKDKATLFSSSRGRVKKWHDAVICKADEVEFGTDQDAKPERRSQTEVPSRRINMFVDVAGNTSSCLEDSRQRCWIVRNFYPQIVSVRHFRAVRRGSGEVKAPLKRDRAATTWQYRHPGVSLEKALDVIS